MGRSATFIHEDSVPQNLSIHRHRESSNSLMDLSVSHNRDRGHHVPLSASLSSSLSSFSSSNSSLNTSPFESRSMSFPPQPAAMKKEPTEVATAIGSNPNIKVIHLGMNSAQNNSWNGIGLQRSKAVIALVSPNNPNSGNYYPAVQTSPVSLVVKRERQYN